MAKKRTEKHWCVQCGREFDAIFVSVSNWTKDDSSDDSKIWIRSKVTVCPYCSCEALMSEMRMSDKKPRKNAK